MSWEEMQGGLLEEDDFKSHRHRACNTVGRSAKDAWQGLGYRCGAENRTSKKDMSLRLRGKE